uniref:Uncharacterized protein n=1 Tax=Chromera velia CCMP2878 TaxID=1169474 RepID=A0A0G4FJ18_9ALVE|eukprot:Cvel_17284.t1-p1 / transcript=Cvel_17284.t1 / gene=Cvel_17284 / organism=Chromera_velia_CCMP2878 / gene_product=hypothetical protein / transcript_product=hypothetical protein / location=Cvel_scaffold1371:18484-21745(-) / protein_length=488 / sequence_SO=supercontig / SO=protein_coding / is_pseudo=false
MESVIACQEGGALIQPCTEQEAEQQVQSIVDETIAPQFHLSPHPAYSKAIWLTLGRFVALAKNVTAASRWKVEAILKHALYRLEQLKDIEDANDIDRETFTFDSSDGIDEEEDEEEVGGKGKAEDEKRESEHSRAAAEEESSHFEDEEEDEEEEEDEAEAQQSSFSLTVTRPPQTETERQIGLSSQIRPQACVSSLTGHSDLKSFQGLSSEKFMKTMGGAKQPTGLKRKAPTPSSSSQPMTKKTPHSTDFPCLQGQPPPTILKPNQFLPPPFAVPLPLSVPIKKNHDASKSEQTSLISSPSLTTAVQPKGQQETFRPPPSSSTGPSRAPASLSQATQRAASGGMPGSSRHSAIPRGTRDSTGHPPRGPPNPNNPYSWFDLSLSPSQVHLLAASQQMPLPFCAPFPPTFARQPPQGIVHPRPAGIVNQEQQQQQQPQPSRLQAPGRPPILTKGRGTTMQSSSSSSSSSASSSSSSASSSSSSSSSDQRG